MRHTIFCNYYQAMSEHTTCKAGVAYEDFKGLPFDRRPCFCRGGNAPPGCDKAQFPDAEQLAKEEEEIKQRFANTMKARLAIVQHLGGPWKKGMAGQQGAIDCPVCNSTKTLRFTRAGYNGHIHAACTTVDCVSWME